MKRFISIIIFILILLNTASAQVMHQLDVIMDIHDDATVDAEFSFRFTDEIKEINLPVSGEVYDIKTENGECMIEKGLKNFLICRPPSPFMVGEIKIDTKFKINKIIEQRENISFFYFDVPILWNTDAANVVVKLPAGMALIDNPLLPLSPSGADVGSDGRRIVLRWNLENQRPGDLIPVRVHYESLGIDIVSRLGYKWIGLILFVIIVGMWFIYEKIEKKSSVVLSVLNEGERIIVNIIRSSDKRKINQRKIVNSSGFSKAKVTRIIQSLEERGIVTVERFGRSNKITLKKKFIEK